MNINPKQYEINGLKINWGETFNKVATFLEPFEKLKPYEGWANIRCKCKNIFGLAATEMEVRAPFPDRPVLQVQYELSPIKPTLFQKLHSPFINQLKKALGKPIQTNSDYHPYGWKKEYISGAVVFSAKWIFDDIRISLSVYGGTRNNDSGDAAAGIFIDWIDEKTAAKPFRKERKKFEDLINKSIKSSIAFKKYSLREKQRQFRVVHFELSDPYIAEKDTELRAAQLALYKRELFQTPRIIERALQPNEIALYTISNMTKLFVSNKWDTIYLDSSNKNSITCCDVLPGRGSGGRELKLKELLIEDERESNRIVDLIKEIEVLTGLHAEATTRYDD